MPRPLPRWTFVVGPLVLALANVGLNALNRSLGSPLFLDSIGTAVAAALWGLGPGSVTAVVGQLGMEAVLGLETAGGTAWPFVVCGLATAALVATFVRSGHFRTLGEVALVTALVTLANAVLGSLVATFAFGGVTLHESDYVVAGLVMGGNQLLQTSFWARVPLNLIDKTIAVVVAYGVCRTVASQRG